jgi:hypothetical protein
VQIQLADKCPHCGALLPAVRDGFCGECRQELSPDSSAPPTVDSPHADSWHRGRRHAVEYFTIPGRILVLTTIILAVAGPWLIFMWLRETLTPGRYRLSFFAIPVWTFLGIAFCITAALFRRFGITVLKQPEQNSHAENESDG